jgi:hypothetical protein
MQNNFMYSNKIILVWNDKSSEQLQPCVLATPCMACPLSFPELGLEELDDLGVHLEALGQDGVGYLRLGPEQGLRGEHDAGQLAIEHRHGPGGASADVVLEVHHPARDHEALPGPHHLGVELPLRADEPDEHLPVLDVHELGGARVAVQRVDAARGEVHAVEGQAERVEPRERLHVARRHARPRRVVRAGAARVRREEEVVGDHRRRRLAREARERLAVAPRRGHAEVLDRLGVAAAGGHERRRRQEEEEQRRRRPRHGSRASSPSVPGER